jgi:hypothetical protein
MGWKEQSEEVGGSSPAAPTSPAAPEDWKYEDIGTGEKVLVKKEKEPSSWLPWKNPVALIPEAIGAGYATKAGNALINGRGKVGGLLRTIAPLPAKWLPGGVPVAPTAPAQPPRGYGSIKDLRSAPEAFNAGAVNAEPYYGANTSIADNLKALRSRRLPGEVSGLLLEPVRAPAWGQSVQTPRYQPEYTPYTPRDIPGVTPPPEGMQWIKVGKQWKLQPISGGASIPSGTIGRPPEAPARPRTVKMQPPLPSDYTGPPITRGPNAVSGGSVNLENIFGKYTGTGFNIPGLKSGLKMAGSAAVPLSMVANAGEKGAWDEEQWFNAMNGNAAPLAYNSNSGALEGLVNIPADTINGLASGAAWLSRKILGTDFGHEQYSGVPRIMMPTMGADRRIESDMLQNFRRSQLDPNMGQSNAAWQPLRMPYSRQY